MLHAQFSAWPSVFHLEALWDIIVHKNNNIKLDLGAVVADNTEHHLDFSTCIYHT